MNELISIIVPVYKVEQYLEKCVDSILAQTYLNLEIVLVDDGSPDRCGEMCDAYAKKDSRVVVIHKENGGLSDARNAGLNIAKGKYIGFVDSDDWIEPDMYEKLMYAMEDTHSDIAVCCIKKYRRDGVVVQNIGHDYVYSGKSALYALICDKNLNNFAWNKLYKAELFSNLRYPKGRVFEDTLFTYKVFERIKRAVYINYIGYHYIRRDDSILGTWPVKVQLDFCVAQQERYIDMAERHPDLIPLLARKYWEAFMSLKNQFISAHEDVTPCIHRIKKEIAPFYSRVKKDWDLLKDMNVTQKLKVTLFLKYPAAYRKLFRKVHKIHSN